MASPTIGDVEAQLEAFSQTFPIHQVSESQGIHVPVSLSWAIDSGEVNPNTRIDSDTDPVASQAVDPPTQAAATFIDGSDPLFSMYNETTAEHDREVAENWRSDADSTIIVSLQNGLFSVTVAILLVVSTLNDTAFYLSQTYQLQLSASLNATYVQPSSSAYPLADWTYTSWSLSLIISLICTVAATLLRQWARRYLQMTQEPRGARNRARVCELVAQGVEMEQLRRIPSVLLGLFHVSVGLVLSGFLTLYLSSDMVDFWITLVVTVVGAGLYFLISVSPLRPNFLISHTPFSSLVWFYWSRLVWLTYKILYNSSIRLPFIGYPTERHLWELARARFSWTLRDTKVATEDLARKRSSALDISVVSRVFSSLDGHEDMEQFLSTIPGFYNSDEVNKDSSALEGLNDKTLAPAIVSFMVHSLSSDLLTQPKKHQRITICLQAMNADVFLLQCTFGQILQTLHSDIFRCIDIVTFALEHLRRDDSDPWVKDFAECIVAIAINRMPLDDGSWIDLAERYLRPSHTQYLREGDDLRLCNVIYLIRQLKDSRLENSNQFKQGGVWRNVLVEALKLEIVHTANDLQLEFCTLLNELDFMALGELQPPGMAQWNAGIVLSCIRTAFVPLREGTATLSTGGQGLVLQWFASHPRNDQWEVVRAEHEVVQEVVALPPLPLEQPPRYADTP
ncbi:hypothetical protein EI94DRAFT_1788939 [Lactarius quietus]|nr:hypothetical protein EI94DRAFT_1788939 [Lactarius quietus]